MKDLSTTSGADRPGTDDSVIGAQTTRTERVQTTQTERVQTTQTEAWR